MEQQDLHQPSPRLPDGWKQFQAENIDITTTSELPSGRHSRSPSVLSNHNLSTMNIQPSQIQSHNNGHGQNLGDFHGGSAGLSGDLGLQSTNTATQFGSDQDGIIAQFAQSSMEEFDFTENSESGMPNGHRGNNGYFHHAAAAGTAAINTATTQPLHSTLNPTTTDHSANSNFDDYYLASNDPSTSSPFLNPNSFTGDTSPPIIQHQQQDSLSPFSTYHNAVDAQQHNTLQPQSQFEGSNNNTLGLHWTHHRSFSDQSDIYSNASPFIGSVHSEHGSPFIHPQNDNNFEDDLREAIIGLDMGAQFDVAAQHYNSHQFDTSTLELDQQGFPVDAPLFEQQDQYQTYDNQNNSRPTSSSSYHHPSFPQSIFTSAHPQNISTSLSQSYQSPPLPSATSIPEIEVTVAPPTPRSQAFNSFFPPQPYNPQTHRSAHNSPSIPSSYIFSNPDPLTLPPSGRRRAVSDSGARPSFSMMPPQTTLSRRVSSGSHPYLAVQGDSPSSSGRSTPNRGHRRSVSSGHNMTHREVLDLVKNDGPREAKNPKKFVCDYPGCGQRFTRNSNKTYLSSNDVD